MSLELFFEIDLGLKKGTSAPNFFEIFAIFLLSVETSLKLN